MSKHQAINRFGVSSNPAFSQFQKINASAIEERMTLDGAVNKTGILLSLCFAGAFFGCEARQTCAGTPTFTLPKPTYCGYIGGCPQ